MSASGTNKEPKGGGYAKPKDLHGWGAAIWELLGLPLAKGRVQASLDGAPVVVSIVPAPPAPPDGGPASPWIRRYGPEGILRGAADDGGPALRERARRLWHRVASPVPTLGKTPFVRRCWR